MKMKNKAADQLAAKQKHRKSLKKANRRKTPLLERAEPNKVARPTILIVCEGKNTEPSYFRQFRLSSATIIPVGEGYNTSSLVNRAIQLANQQSYDQVWCVFDKDDFTGQDFNNAISIAEARGFGVAYSNQAFEYWIILHLEDHQGGGLHRKEYNAKINSRLKAFGIVYEGENNKIITEEIFEILDGIDEKTKKERKILAIERAKRNYNQFDNLNPALAESSTMVFRLVEELLKYV